MRVLLLGASGLLGHNVLRRLLDEGHEVRVLVRRPDAVKLREGTWETVTGSLIDFATLLGVAADCDAIVNCAGVTDMSLLRREDYTAVNTTLCASLLEAMKRLGIRTLVHASTVNTIGHGSAAHPATGQEPMSAPFTESYYAESKRDGEQLLTEWARLNPEWHIVVVNPGYMIGPMDVKPSSGRLLLLGYRKRVMFAPRGGKAFVDVRDVAAAMTSALTRGVNGERYIAVNSRECHTIKELYELQARVMGYRQRVLELPDGLLAVAGRVGDMLRALGVRSEVSTRNVRQLMVREYYDSSHAISDLAMTQTPLEQSIRDFYQWRVEEGKSGKVEM